MAQIKTFPQEIFVYVERDPDDEYLVSYPAKDDALGDEDGKVIGVYKFVRTEKLERGQVIVKPRNSRSTS